MYFAYSSKYVTLQYWSANLAHGLLDINLQEGENAVSVNKESDFSSSAKVEAKG